MEQKIRALMDDILKLREMPLEIRDSYWRHQMADLCTSLAKLVGLSSFTYEDKSWVIDEDLKSIWEVTTETA